MQNQTFSVLVDDSGKWQMQAGLFKTSFHESMEISCTDEKIIINDVQIGEVWLVGGQIYLQEYDAAVKDLDLQAYDEC